MEAEAADFDFGAENIKDVDIDADEDDPLQID